MAQVLGNKKKNRSLDADDEDDDEKDDGPELPVFTALETILSFIPFTKESKIAAAATEMLDNLKRIKKEKSKAYDLMVMSKIGQHEEALKTLLGETTDRIDYFVAMRKRLQDEGKPIRTEVRKDTILSLERGKGKNRLKRATDVERDLTMLTKDKHNTKKKHLIKLPSDHELGKGKIPAADVQPKCGWYGFDHHGIALRCRNVCIIIKQKNNNKRGDTGRRGSQSGMSDHENEKLQFCAFHHPYCLAKKNHTNGRVPIKSPNAAGLCGRCFSDRYPSLANPPVYQANTVPGVVLAPSLLHTVALPKETLDRMNIDNLNRPLGGSQSKQSTFDADTFKQRLLKGSEIESEEPVVVRETILDKPVRSYRVVEMHDMWIAMMSAPRAAHWADLEGARESLRAGLQHRRDMIAEINSAIFERALVVRSAAPGLYAGPMVANAIEASKKMSQRSVTIMVKETKTNEAALGDHRPPGDTTKRNAATATASMTVLRKTEKEEQERKRLVLLSPTKLVQQKEEPKVDDTQAADAVPKKKKKKAKGEKDEVKEQKVTINHDMTIDVKKRAEVFFLNLNTTKRIKKVPEPIPESVDFTRYEERLPSIFSILFNMLAEPIVELWLEYKHHFKTSEDPIVMAKKAKAAEDRRLKGFYATTVAPAVVDIRDTMSLLYNFR